MYTVGDGRHGREKEQELEYLDLEIPAPDAFGHAVKLGEYMRDRGVRARRVAPAVLGEPAHQTRRVDLHVLEKAGEAPWSFRGIDLDRYPVAAFTGKVYSAYVRGAEDREVAR